MAEISDVTNWLSPFSVTGQTSLTGGASAAKPEKEKNMSQVTIAGVTIHNFADLNKLSTADLLAFYNETT